MNTKADTPKGNLTRKGWTYVIVDKWGEVFYPYILRNSNEIKVGHQDDEFNDLIPDLLVHPTKEIAQSWKRRIVQETEELARKNYITRPTLPVKYRLVRYCLTIG